MAGKLHHRGGGVHGMASGESEEKMNLMLGPGMRESPWRSRHVSKGDQERGPRQAKQRKREFKI